MRRCGGQRVHLHQHAMTDLLSSCVEYLCVHQQAITIKHNVCNLVLGHCCHERLAPALAVAILLTKQPRGREATARGDLHAVVWCIHSGCRL